jgi:hypothetical protein
VGDNTVGDNLRFTIDGYPLRIYTVNLAQPWYLIEADLLLGPWHAAASGRLGCAIVAALRSELELNYKMGTKPWPEDRSTRAR